MYLVKRICINLFLQDFTKYFKRFFKSFFKIQNVWDFSCVDRPLGRSSVDLALPIDRICIGLCTYQNFACRSTNPSTTDLTVLSVCISRLADRSTNRDAKLSVWARSTMRATRDSNDSFSSRWQSTTRSTSHCAKSSFTFNSYILIWTFLNYL